MPANPKKRTPESQDALAYAENIIATLREPFVVLDKSLRVCTANTAFYHDFHVLKEEVHVYRDPHLQQIPFAGFLPPALACLRIMEMHLDDTS